MRGPNIVTIYTMERNGVLVVPSKALRFTPTPELMQKDEEIVDCESKDKLWVRDGKQFKAIPVNTGISNGNVTEVSGVKAGTEVITEFSVIMPDGNGQQQNRNPFMPGPRNRNNQKNSAPNGNKTTK